MVSKQWDRLELRLSKEKDIKGRLQKHAAEKGVSVTQYIELLVLMDEQMTEITKQYNQERI